MSKQLTCAPRLQSVQTTFAFDHDTIYVGTGGGARRTRIGNLVEDIALGLLRVAPCKKSGGYDCCFDGKHGDTFYEVKSVRRGGKVVVYKWRLERDEAAGVPLRYVIAMRNTNLAGAMTVGDTRRALAGDLLSLYVVSARKVHAATKSLPLNKLKKGHACGGKVGYTRAGYAEGYYNIALPVLTQGLRQVGVARETLWGDEFTAKVFA